MNKKTKARNNINTNTDTKHKKINNLMENRIEQNPAIKLVNLPQIT